MHAKTNRGDQPAPHTPWFELGLLFAGSRVLIALIARLGVAIVEPGRFERKTAGLAQLFFHWDSGWFLAIAQDGYHYDPAKGSPIAFFPLYPMLMRALGPLLGGPTVAGFLISNAAFFAAIALLWRLVERDAARGQGGVRRGDGGRAVRLIVFGPVSFFFSTVYSESLFLFLAVACVYAGRSRRWWLAGLAGFAAALTRNAGLLLCIPLLLELFAAERDGKAPPAGRRWRQAAACLFPAMGIVAWSGYLAWRFGDPLLFLKVQHAWGRSLSWPWRSFYRTNLGFNPPFYNWWFVGHAAAGIGLLMLGFAARLRPSYLALAAAMLLLNLSATHLEAIPRFLSVIFPLYIAGAVFVRRTPAAEPLALAASAALLAFSTLLFTNGYWFT